MCKKKKCVNVLYCKQSCLVCNAANILGPLYLCLCKRIKCGTVVNFKNCHKADRQHTELRRECECMEKWSSLCCIVLKAFPIRVLEGWILFKVTVFWPSVCMAAMIPPSKCPMKASFMLFRMAAAPTASNFVFPPSLMDRTFSQWATYGIYQCLKMMLLHPFNSS